jgi:hypothetical protein
MTPINGQREYMHDTNITTSNTLPNEVSLNVLCLLMLNRVRRHVENVDIITIGQCVAMKGSVQLVTMRL